MICFVCWLLGVAKSVLPMNLFYSCIVHLDANAHGHIEHQLNKLDTSNDKFTVNLLTHLLAMMFVCVLFLISLMDFVVTAVAFEPFRQVDFFEGHISLETNTACAFRCLSVCVQHNVSCQAVRFNAGGRECHLLDKWSPVNVTTFLSDDTWLIYAVAVCHLELLKKNIVFYQNIC